MAEKTAIIYARVSTSRQADDGLPIASQIERAEEKALSLGAKVLKVFTDAGISGRTDRRPAFQDALAYCALRHVDYFICWSTSRFSRNKVDAGWHKRALRKLGTALVYISTGIDAETDDGWLLEGVFELIDEQYSRTISKDTRRSMMKNAREGYFNGGRVPFGFSAISDGKRKRLVVNPGEAPTVRRIFDACASGAGAKSIAMMLNDDGLFRRGSRWRKGSVIALLHGWTYCGYTIFNRRGAQRELRAESDWIRTLSHEPIITEELFMKVQDILATRAPREGGGSPHSTFVFTGLLRCGACGQNMQIESATGRSKLYHYYNCRSSQQGLGCKPRRIPAREFDEWLVEHIIAKILTTERIADVVAQIKDYTGERAKLRKERRAALVSELRSCETRRDNVYEVLELHGKNAPNLGDLTHRLRAANQRIKTIEEKLTELENEPVEPVALGEPEVAEMAEFIRDMLSDTSDAKRLRTFFSGFIKEIVLRDSEVEIKYHPEKLINRVGFDVVHSNESWLPDPTLLRIEILCIRLHERFVLAA